MRAEWRLDWPTKTVNHTYRVGRGGKPHMDASALTWKLGAAHHVRAHACLVPERKRLAITFYLTPPKGSAVDADNCIKLCQDAVALGLRINDYWIAEVHAYRGPCSADPHVDVVLTLAGWRSLEEVR